MTTKPVNNQGTPSPMTLPRAADGIKAKDVNAPAAPLGAGPSGAAPKPGSKALGTSVQISDDGKGRAAEFQKALEIAKGTPDVREDRVAALKKQIADGTYQVDSGKIADGMLREAIKDRLAEVEER